MHIHRIAQTAAQNVLLDADGRLLRRLGVRDTAVYLVRPDGHIAYRAEGSDLAGADRHLHDLHHP